MPVDGAAIGRTEAARLLAPAIGVDDRVILAVSGGPDSVALMGLAAGVAAGRLLVATVDHGLRPGSTAEAEGVARQAAGLGLPHRILAWSGPKPRTGVQAAARAARYRLLAELAERVGARRVLTAHTLDDQAETLLIRLAAGSGLTGLAGMAPLTRHGGVEVARPFLGVAKARLVATCRARGWSAIADPSNLDPRFARARWRALLPALAAEGLTPARLARLAARLARAEAALEERVSEALAGAVLEASTQTRILDAARLAPLPDEVLLRVIAGVLRTLRPGLAPPRLERVEARVLGDLRAALDAGRPVRLTLGGALLTLEAGGRLTVAPERPRRRGLAPPSEGAEPMREGGFTAP